jgi:diaminohydroxyphosphoribosylaminopyrimidine deaminase/5-amino-6-(5-phosphoribosylamino)uracil reductase
LKWAESADGFIAPLHRDKKEPVWLSNEFSRQLVHKWRSEEQAILVGTKTVLDDNPKLDVRDWNGKNPIRIVIDRTGKIDDSYYVKDKKTKTIFITEQENMSSDENCMYENVIFENRLAEKIGAILYKNNIQSVIIEGGTTTLETFINENLWDEARVFKSKTQLNEGVKSPVLKGNSEATTIQNDELIIFKHHD